jgi:hypothetical protein
MKYLQHIKFTKARIVNLIIIFAVAYNMFNIHYWTHQNRVIYHDVISYYAYLPATMIYKDLSLDFTQDSAEYFSDKFWPLKTPDGRNVIKMSMGLSFMYAPFFVMGHIAANMTEYPADGFSMPYKFFLTMSALFYLALGLFFLRKVLENYFSQKIVIITLIVTVLGTNLYFYSAIESTMPHVYLFALFSAFIYMTIRWYEKPDMENAIIIGLLGGLITLIRPTDIILSVFFFLWDVKSVEELKQRFLFFVRNPQFKIAMALTFVVVWIPQFAYWKYSTGHWLYYSYNDEGFNFLHPHIIDGLFSYRKGWLVYTPVMALAIFGLALSYKKLKTIFYPSLIFLTLNIYIITSWWCWWYGGSFGSRPFIDSYPVLALSFAVFVKWTLSQKKIVKLISNTIIILLILLNLFQTWQYYGGDIHHDAMTKKAYWKIFIKPYPDDTYKQFLDHPDYEKAVER